MNGSEKMCFSAELHNHTHPALLQGAPHNTSRACNDSDNIGNLVNREEFAECFLLQFVINSVLIGLISVVGILGNVISLYMFCRKIIDTHVNYQLLCLAAVDSIYLLITLDICTLQTSFMFLEYSPRLYWRIVHPHLLVYVWPVQAIMRTATVWMTVFIATHRYLAVCKPVSNLYTHVVNHGPKYVALLLVLSALAGIPDFLAYEIHTAGDEDYDWRVTRFGESEMFSGFIVSILNPIFAVFLPLLLLIVMTVLILRKRQKTMRRLRRVQETRDSITMTLLTIVITFIVCQLPQAMHGLFFSLGNFPYCGARYQYTVLANFFIVINSAANGFIYFFMNKEFRSALLFHCRCRALKRRRNVSQRMSIELSGGSTLVTRCRNDGDSNA